MHNTLESHKFFPYVAWSIVIGFALFTYFLTVSVQSELSTIGDGVERLEMRLDEMDTNAMKEREKAKGAE
jgi:hypothetical protein